MTDATKLAREALEAAAKIIEDHIPCFSNQGEGEPYLIRRPDGDVGGLAYAKAIRALSTAPGESGDYMARVEANFAKIRAERDAAIAALIKIDHKTGATFAPDVANRVIAECGDIARSVIRPGSHPPTAPGESEGARPAWRDGTPPAWFDRWFIAETTYLDRVVLRPLPEEYAYDYKTADETYIKREKIKRWMQFPDCEFAFPSEEAALASTPPAAPAREAGMRTAILAEAVRACWSVPLFTGALNNRSGAIIKQDCIDAIRALAQEEHP